MMLRTEELFVSRYVLYGILGKRRCRSHRTLDGRPGVSIGWVGVSKSLISTLEAEESDQ